jgi:hypothetical protein
MLCVFVMMPFDVPSSQVYDDGSTHRTSPYAAQGAPHVHCVCLDGPRRSCNLSAGTGQALERKRHHSLLHQSGSRPL